MTGSDRTSTRSLGKDQGGTAATEFALLVPLLLLFTFGIIQYGMMFFTYNNMSNAAREAARALAVSEVDEAGAETRANDFLVGWPASWVITAEDTGTTGTNYVRVEITVPGSEAGILSFAPAPSHLQAEVFMRKE